ncbi:MAG: N-acetylmuramoyl-L-alanine amidase [bacterium]
MKFFTKSILILIYFTPILVFFSCGVTKNIGFGSSERDIERMYNEAESLYNKILDGVADSSEKNWNYVIKRFSEIAESYPKSKFADNALYNLGLCHIWTYGIWNGSPEKAISAFDNLINRYPESEFVVSAQYWKAYAYSLLGDYEKAIKEFQEFGKKYPNSDLYKESLYQIDECNSKLNKPKVKIEPPPTKQQNEIPTEKKVLEPKSDVPKAIQRNVNEHEIKEQSKSSRKAIRTIRFHSWNGFTRVVIDLSDSARYKIGKLNNPDRIFIDVNNSEIQPSKRMLIVNDDIIEKIRAAQYDKDTVRVVLDVKKFDNYKSYVLENPDRIVIDVYGANTINKLPEKNLTSKTLEKKRTNQSKDKIIDSQPLPSKSPTLVKQLGLKVRTIVIDPGHGGKDPGAIGISGLQEKAVVLDIAKRLKNLLDDRYTVYLTRDSDIYMPLEERTIFANEKGADIFISLHVNSCKNPTNRGIETYYLSLASDEEARLTAALENATSEKNIKEIGSLITKVLKNAKIEESSNFARIVQSSLCKNTGAFNRGVKKAPFIVLIGVDAPSILIELGFISNTQDEELLKDNGYKNELATALMNAIEDYIRSLDQVG